MAQDTRSTYNVTVKVVNAQISSYRKSPIKHQLYTKITPLHYNKGQFFPPFNLHESSDLSKVYLYAAMQDIIQVAVFPYDLAAMSYDALGLTLAPTHNADEGVKVIKSTGGTILKPGKNADSDDLMRVLQDLS
ncbi:hypothetical protein POM88_005117 [Heracleum sosnowskyi]|uniref:Uncharacterized protein n=1 Tax=Heracleum sosnowskyi TaxID=360622 RepID=A0AAD8NE51_9APIA|nr:hypothetical protein POM88_005117 [Heracleum sosnowskyi]